MLWLFHLIVRQFNPCRGPATDRSVYRPVDGGTDRRAGVSLPDCRVT